jgi:hypothetical protein
VVLSFIAVIERSHVGEMESVSIERAELARSDATAAPRVIRSQQVLEHALRHLAWLSVDDAVVAASLPGGWTAALGAYRPEPFRMLG